ncbi:MAG: hypothetical protein KME54_02380 [Tolypothrix brevis GSE-NOS-MK-07-07A]|nr:hypothetical protein [Tolypothrix brevis GSE-NOS-MK-07-07A]
MYQRQNSVQRTRALIDALYMEVEVRKENKNPKDIFHLQLIQPNSRIFPLIDFNRGTSMITFSCKDASAIALVQCTLDNSQLIKVEA